MPYIGEIDICIVNFTNILDASFCQYYFAQKKFKHEL